MISGKKQEIDMGRKGAVKEVISWAVILLVAFVIGNCLNKYVLMKAVIPSGSMENTLQVDDRVFGLRTAYLFSEPERGDVVMFDYPDNETLLYVKRIIGLPGETVEICDGKVYIWNDKTGEDKIMLEEPYLKETPEGFVITEFLPDVPWAGKYNTISCPAGHHFYAEAFVSVFVSTTDKEGLLLIQRPSIYAPGSIAIVL